MSLLCQIRISRRQLLLSKKAPILYYSQFKINRASRLFYSIFLQKSCKFVDKKLKTYHQIHLVSSFLLSKFHNQLYSMSINFLPHPPNSAWLPPVDPNDEQNLQHEEMMIEQQFKNILSQDLNGVFGLMEFREQEDEEEQEEDEDEAEERDGYTDEIQIPEGQEEI